MKKNEERGQVDCRCPYCEKDVLLSDVPYCQPCGVTIRHCPRCKAVVARDADICADCGAELQGE